MSRAAITLALGSLLLLLGATCSTEVRLGPARGPEAPDASFASPDAVADAEPADAEPDAEPADAEPDAEPADLPDATTSD